MITKPMPQELGTVKLLVEKKLAYPIEKAQDIIEVIEDFTPLLHRQRGLLPVTQQLDKVYASDEIARTVLAYCNPSYAAEPASKPVSSAVETAVHNHAVSQASVGSAQVAISQQSNVAN